MPSPSRRKAPRASTPRCSSCVSSSASCASSRAAAWASGPYAFAPTGEGSWRRIATGAPAPRAGGYRLTAEEAEELGELASSLEARPDPKGTLAWAVSRFELGCERESTLVGLSDHLLALRALLEGHGPVGASLPMRAAALIGAGAEDRLDARERVEGALELERSLMCGAPATGSLELARWVEENVRRLLREAALGQLGSDLGTAADETLIAAGLAEGDADISVSVQTADDPRMPGSAASPSDRASSPDSSRGSEAEAFIEEDEGPATSARGEGPATTPRSDPHHQRLELRGGLHGGRNPHPRADPGRWRDPHHCHQLARGGRGRAGRRNDRVAGGRLPQRPPRADRHAAGPAPLPGARRTRTGKSASSTTTTTSAGAPARRGPPRSPPAPRRSRTDTGRSRPGRRGRGRLRRDRAPG